MDTITGSLSLGLLSIAESGAASSPMSNVKNFPISSFFSDLRAMSWLYVPLALFLGTVALYWHRIQIRRKEDGNNVWQRMGIFVAAGIFLLMYMMTKPQQPEPAEGLQTLRLSTASMGLSEFLNMRSGAIVLSGIVMLCQLCRHHHHHHNSAHGGGRHHKKGKHEVNHHHDKHHH